jgi:hypothetical protein
MVKDAQRNLDKAEMMEEKRKMKKQIDLGDFDG